ncbi:MAG TPA: dihydrolipoamide acetyltransferase family protein [Gaiellaceae bacterium]|nr:dihydrolipoamide acetyltransferase family protein [Gaiellaceae bacterium]
MATEIKLPRLGQGMESGTVVRWLKQEGEQVEKGEPLYELDTEKVTQEVEADASGVLLKIAVQEGEVPVGQTIAVIGEEGEDVSVEEAPEEDASVEEASEEEGSRAPARDEERERGREASAEPSMSEQITEVREPSRGDGRVKASPLARRIARERGVELAQVRGTGPEGRIVAEDIERAVAAPAPAAAVAAPAMPAAEPEVEQLTSIRKTIARRLTKAWEAPVFQLVVSADMTRAQALRGRLVELTPDGATKPTVSDVLTKVCAAALLRHPQVNAHYADEALTRFSTADVGMAVATDRGLIVPVIRGAERLSLAEIAAARADLVSRAREAKLQQADLEGGTFTISNLGMYGIEQFVAVLNPPQVAILAVGAIEDKPIIRDGELEVRPIMSLTLTCDHRALDGSVAAEFLGTVRMLLEEPGLAL